VKSMDIELPETHDFYIKLLNPQISRNGSNYGIVNKHTDRTEHTDTILSRCYETMKSMQARWDMMWKEIDANKAKNRIKEVECSSLISLDSRNQS
jgi:hypothetical protein